MIDKSVLEKFLRRECTPEEAALVSEYLRTDPDALQQLLGEEEWMQFENTEKLPTNVSDDMISHIGRNTYNRGAIVKRILRIAVAASVIVCMSVIGWKLLSVKSGRQQPLVAQKNVKAEDHVNYKKNGTSENVTIALNDGSQVLLHPGGEIWYDDVYGQENRNVYLKGEALFTVAQNSRKPFTVLSDGIATTALGTAFTVNTANKNNTVKVALHEGKIVVKSLDSLHCSWKSGFYLKPGDELVYSKANNLAFIKEGPARGKNILAKKGTGNGKYIPDWFAFNNQHLSEVFKQLEDFYSVEIDYKESDVLNMYFIGKFDKSDSIGTILRNIAMLNNLDLTVTEDKYIIRKKK